MKACDALLTDEVELLRTIARLARVFVQQNHAVDSLTHRVRLEQRGVNRIQRDGLPLVGYIAYEHDAEFIATFDPSMVLTLLDEISRLEHSPRAWESSGLEGL